MAEKAFPFTGNGTGDGTSGGYTALEWSTIWNDWFNVSGVLIGVGNTLTTTGTSSPVAVNTGTAIVRGKTYRNTASVNVVISTPSVNTTGGHIILELDWTAQTVRLKSVRNTDGLSAIPSLTQSDSTVWQERLYSYTITTGGVITLTDARTYAHFNTKVSTAMLDDNAVTTAKITDSNITTAKIADSNVTTVKLADNAVTTAKIVDSNVTTAKIADANITTAKIADVNVTTGKLADDAVDDTKVGNRVPQFYRRQGGNASNWNTVGTTTYTPTTVRMQAGIVAVPISIGQNSGSTSVTLPVAFSNEPLVLVSIIDDSGAGFAATVQNTGLSASQFTAVIYYVLGTGAPTTTSINVAWMAIGPE